MSGLTSTDRKISSKVHRAGRDTCDFYEKCFPATTPPFEFWVEDAVFEKELCDALRKRPITAIEIDGACRTYTEKFKDLCRVYARKAAQESRQGAS